jgi:hypothetical protein
MAYEKLTYTFGNWAGLDVGYGCKVSVVDTVGSFRMSTGIQGGLPNHQIEISPGFFAPDRVPTQGQHGSCNSRRLSRRLIVT